MTDPKPMTREEMEEAARYYRAHYQTVLDGGRQDERHWSRVGDLFAHPASLLPDAEREGAAVQFCAFEDCDQEPSGFCDGHNYSEELLRMRSERDHYRERALGADKVIAEHGKKILELERDRATARAELDAARKRVPLLEDSLALAIEDLIWMSGADDFAVDGKAHNGWRKIVVRLEKYRAALTPPAAAEEKANMKEMTMRRMSNAHKRGSISSADSRELEGIVAAVQAEAAEKAWAVCTHPSNPYGPCPHCSQPQPAPTPQAEGEWDARAATESIGECAGEGVLAQSVMMVIEMELRRAFRAGRASREADVERAWEEGREAAAKECDRIQAHYLESIERENPFGRDLSDLRLQVAQAGECADGIRALRKGAE